MRKRSVWVEPLFAEGKDWHGMRRFRLRRLWRVNCEALMRAAGQNLKRLLKKWGWGRRPWPEGAANAAFSLFFLLPSVSLLASQNLLLIIGPLRIPFQSILQRTELGGGLVNRSAGHGEQRLIDT